MHSPTQHCIPVFNLNAGSNLANRKQYLQ